MATFTGAFTPTTWTTWITNGACSTTTCADTWSNWATNAISTSTSTTVSAGSAWITWTQPNTTWTTWTVTSTGEIAVNDVWQQQPMQRTPEQQAEDNRRAAEARAETQRRADIAAAERRKACETARKLLETMLDHQQRQQLQKDRFFEVIARGSNRRYRIREGSHGNVKLLDDKGREVMSYCGQPNGVPTEDSMLAQKLQIEHDEPAFLRVANATRVD